jgi:hypothetical protein
MVDRFAAMLGITGRAGEQEQPGQQRGVVNSSASFCLVAEPRDLAGGRR